LQRLLWAGPLAIVLALIANFILWRLALAVLDIPAEFMPLNSPSPVFLTFAGMLGAVIAFAVVGRLSKRPVRTFNLVALVVLILSFLPDVGLLAVGAPGATLPGVLVLMLMHVVAAGIAVWVLGKYAVEK
jgi:hypothetical protein